MLEVKRKTDAPQRARHAVVRTRPLAPATPVSHVDAINGRKPSVLAPGTRNTAPRPVTPTTREFQTKVPVITGEVNFRGSIPVDGYLSGQLGTSSGCLSVKQKPNATCGANPELLGDLSFRDALRVNGHIAGTVSSSEGTLIVDVGARVDAHIDVAVAMISGEVNGDIIARERVEVGPVARIRGNIWTRAIIIKDGAIFEGVCRMIDPV